MFVDKAAISHTHTQSSTLELKFSFETKKEDFCCVSLQCTDLSEVMGIKGSLENV